MTRPLQPDAALQHIRAITLDLDDTLWAIEPVIRNAERALWQWLGQHYPAIHERFASEDVLRIREEVIQEFWSQSHDFRYLRKKVLARLAVEAGYDESLVAPAFDVFDAARNQVTLFPDVVPELERLRTRYTIVAVTNGNANLEAIGIRHLFDDVVTAVGAGAAKPDARIFAQAVERTGARPEDILHAGDHPETDVFGARQAGLKTAWVNRSGAEWPDHLDAPDAVVECMAGLAALLDAPGKRRA